MVLDNSKTFYKITNPGVEVINLHESSVRFTLLKLKKQVKALEPDVIFTTANHLNLYFSIFRWVFPKKIKFVARESSIVSINSKNAKMPLLYDALIKKYYCRFDHIICQSTYMQHDLCKNYNVPENKTTILHNATVTNLKNGKTLPDNDSTRLYKFITVGRLSPEKGIERIIHAVGLLSVPFKYYIIGEGTNRNILEKLILELHLQDNVFLVGEKPDPYSGMENADLFLMGSYYEGFPNVLLEAGALGIPIIAFDAPGGVNEIIDEGKNGLMVDDNDIIGFAAAIKRALTENFNRMQIIETTQLRFSINKMINVIEQLFTKLV